MTDSKRDRARGALVGLACGDAVGTTLEFKRPGTFEPITDLVGGGPFGLAPGEWTDDTSMALCLAESIVDTGALDLADHHRRYNLWRVHGRLSSNGTCFDIGNTVSSQVRRFEATGAAIDPSPDEHAAANGSLMRLAPVPIAWHADVALAAVQSGESSRSTHSARRPVDACRLFGAMIAALIEGASFADVTAPSFWQLGPLHPEIDAIANGSYRHKSPPEIRGTGYCVDALEAALWAVHNAADFREAVLSASNLGDDADTTAAIAGQLAGARWGYEAIPEAWRSKLVMHDRIVSLADRLFDLDLAAEAPDPASGIAASPDASRLWRFDDALHAWWVKPGQVLAGEYPTAADCSPHKIELLLDAGIRTFVDLTTPDDRLAPYHATLFRLATERGLTVRHESCPIPDLGTIAPSGYSTIVDLIRTEVAEGRPVFVHCWGGVGRTGTVLGCLLADRDPSCSTVDDVLALIAELRHETRKAHRPCPETAEQTQVIASWIARSARDHEQNVLVEHLAHYKRDSPFQRRARLLQSLWRADHGLPSGADGESWSGSRLPAGEADADARNFLTPAIRKLVADELESNAERPPAEQALLTPGRLYQDLLSSQPLCFNLFGELALDLELATKVAANLWPDRVKMVTKISFEYSPGRGDPKYLDNRSAADVLLEHTCPEGGRGFISIEVKYHENLRVKAAAIKPRYEEVAEESDSFDLARVADLHQPPLQQIWLDHLLALSMLDADDGWDRGLFVLLYPEPNLRCREIAEQYRAYLTPGGLDTFQELTIEQVHAAIESETDAEWVQEFWDRYLDWDRADKLLA